MEYPNQLLVCEGSRDVQPPDGFTHRALSESVHLHHSPHVPVTQVSSGDGALTLAGDAVLASDGDLDPWLERAVSGGHAEVLRHLQSVTGRYVAIHQDGDATTVVPDAFAHRAVYYHLDRPLVASSLKLLCDAADLELTPDDRAVAFVRSETFRANEREFVGDGTRFEEVRRVLPNHLLELDGMAVSRRPLFPVDTRGDPSEYVADRIAAAIETFESRSRLRVAITAGWDSRVLLACGRDVASRISWYTCTTREGEPPPDVSIPREMAARHDLDYAVYYPRSLDEEFLERFRRFVDRPDELPKTRHIQFYQNHFDRAEELYLTGHGGELLRAFFDWSDEGPPTPAQASAAVDYPEDPFVRDELESWLSGAVEYADEYGIPVVDLLYWEQRMGRWAAREAMEKDVAINGVSPFANYDLLLAGLRTPREARGGPEHRLLRDVIDSRWPALLTHDFNPRASGPLVSIHRATPPPIDRLLSAAYHRILR